MHLLVGGDREVASMVVGLRPLAGDTTSHLHLRWPWPLGHRGVVITAPRRREVFCFLLDFFGVLDGGYILKTK
jgi:hypothetical protein